MLLVSERVLPPLISALPRYFVAPSKLPRNQSAEPLIPLHEHEETDSLADDDPPLGLSEVMVRSHAPPFAEYLRTHPAPFDLLTYFHCMGRLLVDALAVGHTYRQIFDFLARQQPHPLPVRYRWFTHCLNIFRQQKGLPPVRAPRVRRQLPAVAVNAPDAHALSLPSAARAAPSSPPSSRPVSTLPASSASTSGAASPAASVTRQVEVISPQEQRTREIEARVAKLFRPLTAEDAKHGKPIREAVLDKQRAALEAYERGLRDGSITD